MENNKIPTAVEFITQKGLYQADAVEMIEFAKLHVKAALESAAENATIYYDQGCEYVETDSIYNSYPLDNIK